MSKTTPTTEKLKCPYCEKGFTPGLFTEPFTDNYDVKRWVTTISCASCGAVITTTLVDCPPGQE